MNLRLQQTVIKEPPSPTKRHQLNSVSNKPSAISILQMPDALSEAKFSLLLFSEGGSALCVRSVECVEVV